MGSISSNLIQQQIAALLKQGYFGGPGEIFCTVRKLAEDYSISLVTAHRIVRRLVQQSLLERSGRNMVIASFKRSVCFPRKIGVLVTNLDNPFFSRLLNALENVGKKQGIDIICAGCNYSIVHEAEQLKMLANSGADAFLICPAHDINSKDNLDKLHRPYVLIGRQVINANAETIMVNNYEAGRLAASHLLEQSCRDFFYVGVSAESHDLRGIGFAARLREAGFILQDSQWISSQCDSSDNDVSLLISKFRNRVKTGVFCFHDLLGLRVQRAAKVAGYHIPEEISVIGCDNLPVVAEANLPLSSIGYSITQLAENAITVLLHKCAGSSKMLSKAVVYVDPFLIVRQSSCLKSKSLHNEVISKEFNSE